MCSDIPHKGVLAFETCRRNAMRQGTGWLFSLEEWWAWWQVDGKWERRGRARGQVMMSRLGDGPYCAANVYAASHAQLLAQVKAR